MKAHPDFATVDLPRQFQLGDIQFTPLAPEYVDEDLAAVLATAPLLEGFFGTWPEGLTRQDNLIDLAWHEREFTTRRSFSWILRDLSGVYIGCFYVFPCLGVRGQADAALWFCDIPEREMTARTTKAALIGWLSTNLPTAIEISWTTSPKLE